MHEPTAVAESGGGTDMGIPLGPQEPSSFVGVPPGQVAVTLGPSMANVAAVAPEELAYSYVKAREEGLALVVVTE
jgi:hypothetical protein